ncbi:hypothetical protein HK102_006929 [Quaeritorhiza haematococci]|nr:hypothetical protein HK102_006929 [Quaeritorhiza haematococci]
MVMSAESMSRLRAQTRQVSVSERWRNQWLLAIHTVLKYNRAMMAFGGSLAKVGPEAMEGGDSGMAFENGPQIDERSLSFALKTFQSRADMVLSTKVQLILSKPREARTFEEMSTLERLLTNRLSSFAAYTADQRARFCDCMTYESHRKGTIVLREGHAPDNFYFLLSGQCEILESRGEHVKVRVNILNPGDCFGEIALHGFLATMRTATVVCTMHSEFLRVDKENYRSIVMGYENERDILSRLSIVRKLPIFSEFTDQSSSMILHMAATRSQLRRFDAGHAIIREGQTNGSLFFIVSGTVSVRKKIPFVMRLPTPHAIKYQILPANPPRSPQMARYYALYGIEKNTTGGTTHSGSTQRLSKTSSSAGGLLKSSSAPASPHAQRADLHATHLPHHHSSQPNPHPHHHHTTQQHPDPPQQQEDHPPLETGDEMIEEIITIAELSSQQCFPELLPPDLANAAGLMNDDVTLGLDVAANRRLSNGLQLSSSPSTTPGTTTPTTPQNLTVISSSSLSSSLSSSGPSPSSSLGGQPVISSLDLQVKYARGELPYLYPSYTTIVATTATECLMISRMDFARMATPSMIRRLLAVDAVACWVPVGTVQDAYLKQRRWEEYKRKVVLETVHKKM